MSNKLLEKYGLYIDGKWRNASDGATFEAKSPIDGTHLALCAQATRQDVDDAVNAAWKAFETWKKTTPAERAAILHKIADVIEKNKEWLAEVETRDNGKPIRETLAIDIPMSVDHFRYFGLLIVVEEGQASVLNETFLSLILKEPIGVVGQIVP